MARVCGGRGVRALSSTNLLNVGRCSRRGEDRSCTLVAVESVQFSVEVARFGPDHISFELAAGGDVVTIRRDARDVETIWKLGRDTWQPFLDRIGQPDASSVIDGVRIAVASGAGVDVLTATRELATVVFSEIDWDLGMSSPD